MKRVLGFLFGVLATLWMATPALAWGGLNDSQEPGSVLVFPHFSKVVSATTGGDAFAHTEFQISVVCPNDATCPKPGVDTYPDDTPSAAVYLRGHWVCGGTRSATHTCDETNFGLVTTVWGTVRFNPDGTTQNGDTAVVAAPCPENGYLVVYVVDINGNPIKYDGLTGTMREHETAISTYALHALSIQAAESMATGAVTDDPANGGNGDGQLDFDGNEYQQITGRIQGPVVYNLRGGDNPIEPALIVLTLDVRSGFPNLPTDVSLDFFNKYEKVASVNTSFVCTAEIEMEAPTIGDDCSTGASLCITGMPDADSPDWTDFGVVRSSSATQHDPITGFNKPVTFVAYVEVKNCVASCANVATNTKYAYWLYNDSIPVPTTYCVNLTNCPNPAP